MGHSTFVAAKPDVQHRATTSRDLDTKKKKRYVPLAPGPLHVLPTPLLKTLPSPSPPSSSTINTSLAVCLQPLGPFLGLFFLISVCTFLSHAISRLLLTLPASPCKPPPLLYQHNIPTTILCRTFIYPLSQRFVVKFLFIFDCLRLYVPASLFLWTGRLLFCSLCSF